MDANVTLQRVNPGDGEIVFQAWGSNPVNFQFLTAHHQASLHDANRYVDSLLANPRNLAFHVTVARGAEVVGLVKANVDGHRAQVGYVIEEKHSRCGYATAAVRLLVQQLQTDSSIQRIWATCATHNIASIRVLEKAGFSREGILRRWVIYPSQGAQVHDNLSYVL